MSSMTRFGFAIALGGPLFACGGSVESSTAAAPDPTTLSGTYQGALQSFAFPDGSSTVVLKLAFSSAGVVTGTVYFGDDAPIAPSTDPSVGYPPKLSTSGATGTGLLEGFAFTILTGTYSGSHLHIGFDHLELWQQWCAIQTVTYPESFSATDGTCEASQRYDCVPFGETSSGPAGCSALGCGMTIPTPFDCNKLELCSGGASSLGLPVTDVCTCTSTGCSVPLTQGGNVALDLDLASGTLDGTINGINLAGILGVELTKQ